jgi:hypothetical protein
VRFDPQARRETENRPGILGNVRLEQCDPHILSSAPPDAAR